MDVLGLAPKKLSKQAHLNETAVRDILDGKSKNPRIDTIKKLADALGCTPRDLTDDSDHIESSEFGGDDSDADGLEAGLRAMQATMENSTAGMVFVRELDAEAAAGPSGGLKEVSRENVEEMTRALHGFPRAGFTQLYGAPSDEVGIIEVKGDSNAPDLMPGQKVMVHFGDKTPSPPGFFVLWDGLGSVIKQVEHIQGSDPPRVLITSRNAFYKPYERALGEAHILGRVVGNWRRL